MFNKKKILTTIFLYFIISSSVFAENKIAYLNIDFIVSNTNIGKITLEKLEKIEREKNNEFKLQEKKFKEEENKILASRSIITDEQLKKNIQEFQKKLKNYSNGKSEQIKQLKKNRKTEILNLLSLINPIIETYMENNSISIIIDKKNIYIGNTSYDITNSLIDIINKKL